MLRSQKTGFPPPFCSNNATFSRKKRSTSFHYLRPSQAPARPAALDIDGIKNAVAPSEIGASSQAIYSWGGLALGACSIIKPELVAEKVLGVASSGSNAVMIRGAGLAAALLGARLGRDSDSQAASSAALWLGGWAYMLRNAAGVAGRTQTICALLALSAVRRSGGSVAARQSTSPRRPASLLISSQASTTS